MVAGVFEGKPVNSSRFTQYFQIPIVQAKTFSRESAPGRRGDTIASNKIRVTSVSQLLATRKAYLTLICADSKKTSLEANVTISSLGIFYPEQASTVRYQARTVGVSFQECNRAKYNVILERREITVKKPLRLRSVMNPISSENFSA